MEDSDIIVYKLRELLKKELAELSLHLELEKLDSEDVNHIDNSWIYDMYRATDCLNRDVPWEEILRILL